jgi:hypothetical protein
VHRYQSARPGAVAPLAQNELVLFYNFQASEIVPLGAHPRRYHIIYIMFVCIEVNSYNLIVTNNSICGRSINNARASMLSFENNRDQKSISIKDRIMGYVTIVTSR